MTTQKQTRKITNSRPVPHIPLPFKEVIADVLKVKTFEKSGKGANRKQETPQCQ